MKPFFFGPSQRPLFGIHQAPTAGSGATAVLLCSPFGQEAIRSHRAFRVIANKLSRAAHHVLRFDYSGTGDSAGPGEDADQARWIADILEASDELASSTGARRISWVGLRYGATLAALAAEKAPQALANLILWDPVVSGADYLAELAEAHTAFMREDLAEWQPSPEPSTEVMGFPLPASLRRAMEKLDLTAHLRFRAGRVTVVESRADAGIARLKRSLNDAGTASRWVEVNSATPWNSEQAMNSSVIPMEIVDAIVGALSA